ncbi:hypothetical protein [Rhizobium sp. BG4]|uniref:hypothetical protein n=1 Tax=Rhizobium sp. BG4 TaxID=2613770 RepID=UPI001FEFA8CE|nr:hypothetical protein [Rhizobium sp. BG4]
MPWARDEETGGLCRQGLLDHLYRQCHCRHRRQLLVTKNNHFHLRADRRKPGIST